MKLCTGLGDDVERGAPHVFGHARGPCGKTAEMAAGGHCALGSLGHILHVNRRLHIALAALQQASLVTIIQPPDIRLRDPAAPDTQIESLEV